MEEKEMVLKSGGGDCPEPHFALHLGHFWTPPGYPCAQTRLQLQGGEQSRVGSVLIFFCRLGNERHVSAVHQVGGTLEGRERHWGWVATSGEGRAQVKPRSCGPLPHLLLIPTPGAGPVMMTHFTEDVVEALRGRGSSPRSHTEVLDLNLGLLVLEFNCLSGRKRQAFPVAQAVKSLPGTQETRV